MKSIRTYSLKQETIRQLDQLKDEMEESRSRIVEQAIARYYQELKNKADHQRCRDKA